MKRRPKADTPRAHCLALRLTEDERDRLRQWAQDAGQAVGAYIWDACEERAALDAVRPPPDDS